MCLCNAHNYSDRIFDTHAQILQQTKTAHEF